MDWISCVLGPAVTVFVAVLIFLIKDRIKEAVLVPRRALRDEIDAITSDLDFFANVIPLPIEDTQRRPQIEAASQAYRKHAMELRARCRRAPMLRGTRKRMLWAADKLIGLSNFISEPPLEDTRENIRRSTREIREHLRLHDRE